MLSGSRCTIHIILWITIKVFTEYCPFLIEEQYSNYEEEDDTEKLVIGDIQNLIP